MKVAVIGAGAIGSLYSAFLSNVCDVFVVNRNKEHIDKIKRDGLLLLYPDGSKRFFKNLRAFYSASEIKDKVDLIFIFVKSYDTKEAVESCLSLVYDDTLFITLQNGFGNVEVMALYVEKEKIFAGITTFGATLVKPGVVAVGGFGRTEFGALGLVAQKRQKDLFNLFKRANLNPVLCKDPYSVMWKKLIVNAVINPLTAIFGIKNGEFAKSKSLRSFAELLVEEACMVARYRGGYDFDKGGLLDVIYDVAEKTAHNESSMLQDIKRCKKTEIDFINGAIVNLAKGYGLSVPVNECMVAVINRITSNF